MKLVKKPKGHALTPATILKRYKRSWPLYLRLRKDRWKRFITSNEAWFYISNSGGKRNVQYISRFGKRSDAEVQVHVAHPKGIMVWLAISTTIKQGWTEGQILYAKEKFFAFKLRKKSKKFIFWKIYFLNSFEFNFELHFIHKKFGPRLITAHSIGLFGLNFRNSSRFYLKKANNLNKIFQKKIDL
jgi:hypothetical protein